MVAAVPELDPVCQTTVGTPMIQRDGDWWMESREIGAEDRSFELAFWKAQSPDAVFRAGWELVELAAEIKHQDKNELRLQRSLGVVGPIRG